MGSDEGDNDESPAASADAATAGRSGESANTLEETNMTVTDAQATSQPADADGASTHSPLAPGTTVEVRSSFDRNWSKGFEVVEVIGTTYKLRRLSDGAELPGTFRRDDLRRERRGGQWWY